MDTGFKDDYVQLDGSQKIFVDKAPDRIKMRGMESRQPLHSNLVKCNKLKTKKMGLRIIFREVEDTIHLIQIAALGKRDKEKFISWLKNGQAN